MHIYLNVKTNQRFIIHIHNIQLMTPKKNKIKESPMHRKTPYTVENTISLYLLRQNVREINIFLIIISYTVLEESL